MPQALPTPVVLARHAMATRFEIALHGRDPVALRAAGEEALTEIERLEDRLSLYRPTSEIARVNAGAAQAPVRVSPDVFRLLHHAQRLSLETGGAFDITIAPLVRCWGFMGGRGAWPDPQQLAAARACVGMHFVELNESAHTVRFARPGVMLDLGAIGKGYALDCAAEILRDAGVTSALLHGGTSTTYALGRQADGTAWKVAIEGRTGVPPASSDGTSLDKEPGRRDASPTLAVVPLCDESLSVSAVWGRAFERDGEVYGHVLDPRTGQPASEAQMAAVVLPSATETDALSTALLTLGRTGLDQLAALRANARTLLAGTRRDTGEHWTEARGLEV
jgi:thiamine biosynthesis lipoprotein